MARSGDLHYSMLITFLILNPSRAEVAAYRQERKERMEKSGPPRSKAYHDWRLIPRNEQLLAVVRNSLIDSRMSSSAGGSPPSWAAASSPSTNVWPIP